MIAMKPEVQSYSIVRVTNGWIVRNDSRDCVNGGAFSAANICVARTPKELAQLIETWAQQQTDLP